MAICYVYSANAMLFCYIIFVKKKKKKKKNINIYRFVELRRTNGYHSYSTRQMYPMWAKSVILFTCYEKKSSV